jgi:predicted nucleic acid-binding protein
MVHLSNLVKKDKAELAKEVNDKLIISNQTIKELNKKQLTDDDLLSQITLLEAKNRELV